MKNMNLVLQKDPLAKLVQEENFIGWVYAIDYDTALVMTNDLWKFRASGVPHNSFLLAATFSPRELTNVSFAEKEILLFRVLRSAKLPQDDDLVRTKIDYFQQQLSIHPTGEERDYDDLTRGQMQFGGLTCRILGTFYTQNGDLRLGSDLESFATASRLNVYRPRGEALKAIVNYVDPIRHKKAEEDALQLGIKEAIPPFRIGTVRYTSTDRLHRQNPEDLVEVCIQPSDFLARRTAVLGMTRTGKSNMVKQTVAVVKRVADTSGVPIGQIIYDINGEYANANNIDKGSLANVYEGETICYRMLETEGFEELQNNFYLQINEAMNLIRQIVKENANSSAVDVKTFLDMTLDEPDRNDHGLHNRWQVRVAAFKALLYKAGFHAPQGYTVSFKVSQEVHQKVAESAGQTFPDPLNSTLKLTLDQAIEWFTAARTANGKTDKLKSSGEGPWLEGDTKAILNMITCKNEKGSYFNGFKVLSAAKKYHSSRRSQEVGAEIYDHLKAGKIVILDLSVGDPTLRERISKQIAQYIFDQSMNSFIQGKYPPNIVVYVEEAHNLIGEKMQLTETWPRLAKEGAKYRIALVYATQEISSVHPNILANTENWFITHLNNDREVKELARFYDFEDFSRSLIHVQDVGFARVKTLSGPFVIPVQIDQFDPNTEKDRVALKRSQKRTSEKRGVEQTGPGLFDDVTNTSEGGKEAGHAI